MKCVATIAKEECRADKLVLLYGDLGARVEAARVARGRVRAQPSFGCGACALNREIEALLEQ